MEFPGPWVWTGESCLCSPGFLSCLDLRDVSPGLGAPGLERRVYAFGPVCLEGPSLQALGFLEPRVSMILDSQDYRTSGVCAFGPLSLGVRVCRVSWSRQDLSFLPSIIELHLHMTKVCTRFSGPGLCSGSQSHPHPKPARRIYRDPAPRTPTKVTNS